MSRGLALQKNCYLSNNFVYIHRLSDGRTLHEEQSDATNDVCRTGSIFRAPDRSIARLLDVGGVASEPTHTSIGVRDGCCNRLINLVRQGRGQFTHHRHAADVRQVRLCLKQRLLGLLALDVLRVQRLISSS